MSCTSWRATSSESACSARPMALIGIRRSAQAKPVGSTTKEFEAFFKSEVARFARVIEAAKIPKLD